MNQRNVYVLLATAQNLLNLMQHRLRVPVSLPADEPTGNLDSKSADRVFELMREVSGRNATSFLFVTHNMALVRRCERIVELVDGRIVAPSPAN